MSNKYICRFPTEGFYIIEKCIPYTITAANCFMYIYVDALILTFLLILILIQNQVNFNLHYGVSFMYIFKLYKSRKSNVISINGKSIHLIYIIIIWCFSLTTVLLVICCVHMYFLLMYTL